MKKRARLVTPKPDAVPVPPVRPGSPVASRSLSRRAVVKAVAGVAGLAMGAPFVSPGRFTLHARGPGGSGRVGIGGRDFDDQYHNTLLFVSRYNSIIAERPDLFVRVDSVEDLASVHGSGRVGILIGTQTSSHFRGPDDVNAFRDKIDIEGVDHPKRMFDLTEALIRRGYTDEHIRGILGENFQRALGDIWTV